MRARFFDGDDLDVYRAAGDPLARLLGDPRAHGATGERWLVESEAKRLITWHAYWPLLDTEGLRVLDIGGGHSSLTHYLADRHDYTLCDLAAHDKLPLHAVACDWWDLPYNDYDILIAADLFPNVDQRLDEFLARYARPGLRLVLTVYEHGWHRARRVDGDEILTVRLWDWAQTRRVLRRRLHVDGAGPWPPEASLFPNGRQVCLVTL